MRSNKAKSVMYSSKEARRTLDPRYTTPYLKQAQWAELTKLKEIIGETYNEFKRPLTIFDIGIGYSRVPILLSSVPTWDKIKKYVGIDISKLCIAKSKKNIKDKRIASKVKVIQFDAVDLSTPAADILKQDKYELVVCTYLTAGDFKPSEIKLETKKDGAIVDYDINLLKPNKDFVSVFRGAYDLLQDNGRIVIGSVYCDNDLARKAQEDFYKRCGMTVITSSKDPFAATAQGFWSERFDQEKIYNYLSWIRRNKIELIPLDDYNFAIMVIAQK